MKLEFVPNRGVNEDTLRPRYYLLHDAIHHQLAKLQRRQGPCDSEESSSRMGFLTC
jgi:hypothetical protein